MDNFITGFIVGSLICFFLGGFIILADVVKGTQIELGNKRYICEVTETKIKTSNWVKV